MQIKKYRFLIVILLISACTQPIEEPQQPTATAEAHSTPTAYDEGGVLLELPTPIPGTVALDFSARPCSASWSNNGEYLPCPGDMKAISGGYADRFDETVIDGNIHIYQPSLLTIPAQPASPFQAIFGKYPPFTLMEGDRFRAVLACADGHPNCEAAAALEYYNSNGYLIQIPGAKWNISSSGERNYVYADVDLSLLAGQTVQFSLSVRDNGKSIDNYIVWIQPHIARIGGAATDAIPPEDLNPENDVTVPVSGIVDLRSAPPYLYDDHPPGSPAAVVFFNVDNSQWSTVTTTRSNAEFTIQVNPGAYYVIAYTYGVGDTPYVSGAYTGVDPSCGNAPAILEVFANKPVGGVKVNDWNWSCGGSAVHPQKPEEVALP